MLHCCETRPAKARRVRLRPLDVLLGGRTRFGRLTLVRDLGMVSSVRTALFRCDCGAEKPMRIASVKDGFTASCGCLQRELASTLAARTCVKHGDAFLGKMAAEYGVYRTMLSRCYNPNVERYPIYGGRGIKVCERWRGSEGYQRFIEDMGRRPSLDHSIDRIDPDGDYEPANVRWASRSEQNSNRRNNRRIVVNGESLTISEASARYGIRRATLAYRINAGVSPEDAVSAPIKTGPYAKAGRVSA